jgi:DNA-binding LacI/PurR family transcriptional regulator
LGGVNEAFAELISPTFSSIDEKSKEPGKCAANIYFKNILGRGVETVTTEKIVIKSEIIIRESSSKSRGS